MKKKIWKQWISLIVSFSMIFSCCPIVAISAATTDGLVLSYDFEEVTDGVVTDTSGNGYDGTIVSSDATLRSGVTGNALDTGSGYVQIPAEVIKDLTDVTVVAQVYIDELTQKDSSDRIIKPTTMFSAGYGNHSKSYFMINTQSFDFASYHEGCGYTINTPSYSENRMAAAVDVHPIKGQWNTLAMTQSGTTVKVYLNGTLVRQEENVTVTMSDVYAGESTPVMLGGSVWNDYLPDGCYDNFKIYNRALEVDEIPGTDLVLSYDFETIENGVVVDGSGNGYNGTISGAPALAEGTNGNGLNLIASGDYVNVPSKVLQNLTDATITGQVYLTSRDNVATMFSAGYASQSKAYIGLMSAGINVPTAGYEEGYTFAINGASRKQVRVNGSLDECLPVGEWCSFAVVHSGTTVTLYINGEEVASKTGLSDTIGDVYVDDTTPVYLGKAVWNDPQTYGIFDNFKIYNRALAVEELPGKPVVEVEEELTPFEETVDYIQRAVDFLINDGNALPQSKDENFTVEWSVVSGDAEIVDGALCKTETSAERQPVVLQAVITGAGEGESETLTFENVTLIDPYAGYILSFFGVATDAGTGSSAENFRLAYSYDGLHWATLNNNEPVVKPTLGTTKRVRDPYIMRNKDGSFTLMSTQGWDTPYLYFWHSDNLTEFDNERLLQAAYSGVAGLTGSRAWAPEGMYDPITDQYYIYWSDPSASGGKGVTYYNTSADLESLSQPGILFNPGYRHLDANIVKYDGSYYMDFRHYTEYNVEGKSGIRFAMADRLEPGAFTAYTEDVNPYRSDSASEGSFVFKVNGENKWYLYWDYNDIFKFGVMETTDLASGEWTYLGINEHMPHEVVRHGGSIPVTQKELDAIIAKWNPNGETITIAEVEEFEDINVTGLASVEELGLPETADVVLSNGKSEELALTWNCDDYVAGKPGSYEFVGTLTLTEGITESDSSADVKVIVTVSKDALSALYEAHKDDVLGDYSNSTWDVFAEAMEDAKVILDDEGATQTQINDAEAALTTAIEGLKIGGHVNVIALIDAIGEVTLDSGEAIETARDAYDDLDEGKERVTNYQVLVDAEHKYAVMVAEDYAAKAAAAAEAAEQAYQDALAAAEKAQAEIAEDKEAAEKAAAEAQAAKAAAEAAKEAAEAAQEAAESANKEAAEEAAKAAEDAAKVAEMSKEIAEALAKAQAAQAAAEAAQKASEDAKEQAETAQTKAEAAQKESEDAKEKAEVAQKAAEEAEAKAEAAKKAAEEAQSKGEAAQKAAEEALKAAEAEVAAAKQALEEAQKLAEDTQAKADSAIKAAEEAQKKAEEAAQRAEEAQKKAEEESKAAADAAELTTNKYNALILIAAYSKTADTDAMTKFEIAEYQDTLDEAMIEVMNAKSADEISQILDVLKADLEAILNSCPATAYVDVDTESWYHEGVDFVVRNGYMTGMSEDVFGPAINTSRAMMVTVLYRIAGCPDVEGLEHPFEDIEDGTWYTDAVTWAYNAGVVTGINETTFDAVSDITREQWVTMLYRYESSITEDDLSCDPDMDKFADPEAVSDFAEEAMKWAVDNKLVMGIFKDGLMHLAPQESAARAQIATILERYMN